MQIFIITLVFEKTPIFFAENSQKSQKIVIITSTPDSGEFSPIELFYTRAVILKNYLRCLHYFLPLKMSC
jgi:hypothetical protein